MNLKIKKSNVSKKIFLGILVIFLLIQFYRPEKNISTEPSANEIELHYNVPEKVQTILQTSCYDCHSNNTKYPWYNNVQPIASWLNSHVIDGKKHLNFDEFNAYTLDRKRKKLKEIGETLEENEMPLPSYTIIHGDAKLSDTDKKMLIDWTNSLSDGLK